MKQILVYADSLSWGIIPGTRKRLSFDERWPGVLENSLAKENLNVRVIENCLNGRRTVWEDPFNPGRNGLTFLGQTIELCSPLDLIMIMLGTNDFQSSNHIMTAWQSTMGLERVIKTIRSAPVEPGITIPPIVIIGPPDITQLNELSESKFKGAIEQSKGLCEYYKTLAGKANCTFVNSNDYIQASKIDGVHLDKDAHLTLGSALTDTVKHTLL